MIKIPKRSTLLFRVTTQSICKAQTTSPSCQTDSKYLVKAMGGGFRLYRFRHQSKDESGYWTAKGDVCPLPSPRLSFLPSFEFLMISRWITTCYTQKWLRNFVGITDPYYSGWNLETFYFPDPFPCPLRDLCSPLHMSTQKSGSRFEHVKSSTSRMSLVRSTVCDPYVAGWVCLK